MEASRDFRRLCDLLSEKSFEFVCTTVEGGITETSDPELFGVLRRLARQTGRLRAGRPTAASGEMRIGKISEILAGVLVLKTTDGVSTAIPRDLARSVHREHLNDCIALILEKIDTHQVIFSVLPAVETSPPAHPTFSPFGRATIHQITEDDARLLSGAPEKLTVLVPVNISS
jgi:hypothetical protein